MGWISLKLILITKKYKYHFYNFWVLGFFKMKKKFIKILFFFFFFFELGKSCFSSRVKLNSLYSGLEAMISLDS